MRTASCSANVRFQSATKPIEREEGKVDGLTTTTRMVVGVVREIPGRSAGWDNILCVVGRTEGEYPKGVLNEVG